MVGKTGRGYALVGTIVPSRDAGGTSKVIPTVYVARLSRDKKKQWERVLSEEGACLQAMSACASNDTIYIVGTHAPDSNSFSMSQAGAESYTRDRSGSPEQNSLLLAKVLPDGELKWMRRFRISAQDTRGRLVSWGNIEEGRLVVCGSIADKGPEGTLDRPFLAEIDRSGQLKSTTVISEPAGVPTCMLPRTWRKDDWVIGGRTMRDESGVTSGFLCIVGLGGNVKTLPLKERADQIVTAQLEALLADEDLHVSQIEQRIRQADREPADLGNRFALANLLEYVGYYDEAVAHYTYVVDADQTDDATRAEARAHLITCRFLAQVRSESEHASMAAPHAPGSGQLQDAENVVAEGSDVHPIEQSTYGTAEFSPERIRDRSVWGFLKGTIAELVDSGVRMGFAVGGVALLDRWLGDPAGGDVRARNRMLAGMVSSLSSAISRHPGLGGEVLPNVSWPAPGFADVLEEAFVTQASETAPVDSKIEREINLGEGYRLVPQWEVPLISGTYDVDCSTWDESQFRIPCPSAGPWTQPVPGASGTVTTTRSPMEVQQNGRNVVLRSSESSVGEAHYHPEGIRRFSNQTETVGRGVITDDSVDVDWTIVYTATDTWGNAPAEPITSSSSSVLRILSDGRLESMGVEYVRR